MWNYREFPPTYSVNVNVMFDRYELEGNIMLNAHSRTYPIQINQGMLFVITITHDEADMMIIQQLDSVGATNILIVADDNMFLRS